MTTETLNRMVNAAQALSLAANHYEKLIETKAAPQQVMGAQNLMLTCQRAFLQIELENARATNDAFKFQAVSSQIAQTEADLNFLIS